MTETTSSTVIDIETGEVVAESSSSSSAETNSDPQVEEFTDFIEGDRETTMTSLVSGLVLVDGERAGHSLINEGHGGLTVSLDEVRKLLHLGVTAANHPQARPG